MTEKIIKLPKKKKKSPKKQVIEELKSKYPRIKKVYQYTEIKYPEEKKIYDKYGCDEHDRLFRVSKTLIDEGHIKLFELDLQEQVGARYVLEHILYKSLKSVYGNPDRLIIHLMTDEYSSIEEAEDLDLETVEWSYLLRLTGGHCIEIKRGNTPFFPSFIIRVNIKEKPFDKFTSLHETIEEFIGSKEDPTLVEFLAQLAPGTLEIEEVEEFKNIHSSEDIATHLFDFLNLLYSLITIVDTNYSIEDVSDHLPIRYMTNLYFEFLQSGHDILELAEEFTTKKNERDKGILHFGQLGKIINNMRSMGTLFISATMYYLMALEGFINVLYEFLLKPDFKYEQYERSIRESGLELKILHLPVYCRGFSSSKITPEDDAVKYWKQIRGFRNKLVHANLSEEHEWLWIFEDGAPFSYNILFHWKFNGKIKNHTNPWLFRKDDAIRVRNAVEKIVTNIIEKMDDNEKYWVKSWINNSEINPLI